MEITAYVRGIDRLADALGLIAKPIEPNPTLPAFDLPDGSFDMAGAVGAITPAMVASVRPLDHATEPLPQDGAYMTTDHAASSYGMPVLVKRGQAFGPGDLPGLALYVTPRQAEMYGAILTAGGWSWYTDEATAESAR